MQNPEKVVDVLTEKIEQLESDLRLSRWKAEQAEKELEQLKEAQTATVIKVDGRLTAKKIEKIKKEFEKGNNLTEIRPATEKAEETR